MHNTTTTQRHIVKQYKKWVTIAHNAAKAAKDAGIPKTACPTYVAADNVARDLLPKIKQ